MLPDSVAGRSNLLQTGDRLLKVNRTNLRYVTHGNGLAVEASLTWGRTSPSCVHRRQSKLQHPSGVRFGRAKAPRRVGSIASNGCANRAGCSENIANVHDSAKQITWATSLADFRADSIATAAQRLSKSALLSIVRKPGYSSSN